MDRRTFLKAAGLGAGAAALGTPAAKAQLVNIALPSLGLEPRRARTPVGHLVVVMMENRSADHYLGWYGAENPHFDGIQHAAFPDLRTPEGPMVPTQDWGERGIRNYHGRGHPDPNHSWGGGRVERNGGRLDGWLDPRTGNDEFALSYYDAIDLPVWAQLARGWQAYDRWFCSVLGPTYPNRYYLHSAQSAGMKQNSLPPEVASEHPEWAAGWDWPTIWTLFERYGVTAGYYFSNLPEIALWGHRHLRYARHISNFYADAAAGTLPQVSFLAPWFSAPAGLANDDHPLADIRLGQQFLSDVVEAFCFSPHYRNGALVITYDEWGGFWDHVDPPRVPDDRATPEDPGGPDDFGQLGFRIPSTIVSPWTRGRRVDHTIYEHTSILKFISDNWGLPFLTTRHRMANSIEHAFRRFRRYDPEPSFVPYEAPAYLLVDPYTDELGAGASGNDLHRLAEVGWFDALGIRTDWSFADSFLRRHALVEALSRAAR